MKRSEKKPVEPEVSQSIADFRGVSFCEQLRSHMDRGTRPSADRIPKYRRWSAKELAWKCAVSERSVHGWLAGRFIPIAIDRIEIALFGDDPTYHNVRISLRAAWSQARARRNKPQARINLDLEGEQIASDHSDIAAADDPLRQQLQKAITFIVADLTASLKQFANSRLWGRLAKASAEFHAVIVCDPLRVTERLGEAYALLLQLEGFLETDTEVQRTPGVSDMPLDPEIRGLLTDLVRIAAPWLRGFPTVKAWEDVRGRVGRS